MRKTRRQQILTGRKPSLKRKGGASSLKKNTRSTKRMSMSMNSAIVPTFLHMLNTVKLYHWKTTSFSTHKATDELYASLNEKLDHFVEVMLGKNEMGGRAKLLNVSTLNLDVYSNNESFIKQIEIYKTYLLNLSNDTGFNILNNVDLLAIRDEIVADFNKFLYLLSLN
jgi:DNA-binding ferritin-like protein